MPSKLPGISLPWKHPLGQLITHHEGSSVPNQGCPSVSPRLKGHLMQGDHLDQAGKHRGRQGSVSQS